MSMSQRPPVQYPHYPVTGVCIVSDPQKCPPGYDILLRSGRDDCDLWSDSLLRRTTRYLCFTKQSQVVGRNSVLTGIAMFAEREIPPPAYTLVDRTFDTSEKALKKKQIGIKMAPRESATDAVVDIFLQNKSKRPADGCTVAGEINGLLLCFKMGKVPIESQPFSHSSPASNVTPSRSAPLPPLQSTSSGPAKPPKATPRPAAAPRTVNTNGSQHINNPLTDVHFQLNLKHENLNGLKNKPVPEILFRSFVDIENEYNYTFTLEKCAVTGRH